jgi:hypothetical protein
VTHLTCEVRLCQSRERLTKPFLILITQSSQFACHRKCHSHNVPTVAMPKNLHQSRKNGVTYATTSVGCAANFAVSFSGFYCAWFARRSAPRQRESEKSNSGSSIRRAHHRTRGRSTFRPVPVVGATRGACECVPVGRPHTSRRCFGKLAACATRPERLLKLFQWTARCGVPPHHARIASLYWPSEARPSALGYLTRTMPSAGPPLNFQRQIELAAVG